MEVLSPPSATFSLVQKATPGRAPDQRAGAANPRAPSVVLPLQFILTGILALLTGSVWLVQRPDLLSTYHYNPDVIALTHLFVLGWISSTIMGAMYQLVPVALETQLYSEKLARWHFVLHVIGFIGMVAMFRIWNMKQVGRFGSLLAGGVGLFVYNLARTLVRIPRWSVVAAGIAASLCWLPMTVLTGLCVALAKIWPGLNPFLPLAAMHAHAHLGGLGFFVMLIVSVSYRLVPMFTLGELRSMHRAAGSLVLLNAGLAGTVVMILASSPWKFLFACVVFVGLLLYLLEIAAIVRGRRRRVLDWGLKYFLTALALLALVSLLGLVLAWVRPPSNLFGPQFETAYGFLALIGVVTFAILGMLYKVVPFLVWYASYSRAIGRSKVPSLASLYSPTLQFAGYWLFVIGIFVTSIAAAFGHARAVQTGCAFLLGGLALFAANMGRILAHLIWPRLEPLVIQPAVGDNR